MARRRTDTGEPVPERLARFVPSEWPGGAGDLWAQFEAWKAEMYAWMEAHPDSPLGDRLDAIRLAAHTKLRLAEEGSR
jgi:hypothetical protein